MKSILSLVLTALLLVATAGAQTTPPVNARASVDASGEATVEWMGPFSADYMDDFEDGTAEGWVYDVNGNWEVEDGTLTSSFFGGGWSSAYYSTEMIGEGIFETTVARELGNATRAASLVLFNQDFYPDSLANGFIFNVVPGNDVGDYQGSYSIYRFMNNESFVIDGQGYSPTINNGLGAYNTLSVAYEDNSVTFYINGYEVFTYHENMAPLSGYFGVAATEEGGTFPDYAVVHWDYAAYDSAEGELRAAPANLPGLPDLNRILPVDRLQADLARQPNAQLSMQELPATNRGFFAGADGARELDEFLNFNIYRDGTLVGTSTTSSFTETIPEYGFHEYLVTALYDEGESMPDTASVLYKDPAGIVIDEDFNDGALPDGWTIEATVPQHTWHIDDGSELGLFDTPYMLVNDEESGGADLDERLVTPEIDVNGSTLLFLEFDHQFFDADFEFGHVQYQLNNGDWESVYLYHDTMMDTAHAVWDLSDYVAPGSTVKLGFLYDDFMDFDGLYWGIDNVLVYVQYGGQQDPVYFNVTPTQSAIQPEGGTVLYDAQVSNNTGNSFSNVRYWLEVEDPNGTIYGPLVNQMFTLQPFQTITVQDLAIEVPGDAPGGNYEVTAYVGYMQGPFLTDTFGFLKLGLDPDGTSGIGEWSATGFDVASDTEVTEQLVMPDRYQLGTAYPNPFNPSTTLSVTLPEASELSLIVYNVNGRQVAELANGRISAGSHSFTFDAGNLASGLYFVRANVPGKLNAVQKVVLTK